MIDWTLAEPQVATHARKGRSGPTTEVLLDLQMKSLTPLALGGAQREAHEQYGSAAGAIRWWLRALLGSTVHDLATLAQWEARIMGGTNWARPFHLSTEVTGAPYPAAGQPTPPELLGPPFYVTFPFDERRNHQHYLSRGLYRPGAVVRIEVTNWQLQPRPYEGLLLAAAIWCWTNLGGFGARSRRGLGALSVTSATGRLADGFNKLCIPPDNTGPQWTGDIWVPPQSQEDWKTFLQIGLVGAIRAAAFLTGKPPRPVDASGAGGTLSSTAKQVPLWPSFAPDHWRLVLTNTNAPNWPSALRAMALPIRRFRENPGGHQVYGGGTTTKDYAGLGGLHMAGFLATGSAGTPPGDDLMNDEFGLPWPWYNHLQDTAVVEPISLSGESAPVGRRASPLLARPVLLHPTDGQNDVYGALYLAFRSQFLPSGSKLAVTGGKGAPAGHRVNPVKVPPAALPQITAFMQGMSNAHTATFTAGLGLATIADLCHG